MLYHTSYPEVMVTYTTLQSQNLCSALVEVYILRMSVLYCNSESNLMATYTMSKLCSLIKDTNAL